MNQIVAALSDPLADEIAAASMSTAEPAPESPQSDAEYIESLRAVCYYCGGERAGGERVNAEDGEIEGDWADRHCTSCGSTAVRFVEPEKAGETQRNGRVYCDCGASKAVGLQDCKIVDGEVEWPFCCGIEMSWRRPEKVSDRY